MRTSLAVALLAFMTGPALADARSDSMALYRVTIDAKDRLVEIAVTPFNGEAEARALADRIGGEVLAPLSGAFAYWFRAAKGEVVQALGNAVRGKDGDKTEYAYDEFIACQKASIALGNYAFQFQQFLVGALPAFDAEAGAKPFATALVECEADLGIDAEGTIPE